MLLRWLHLAGWHAGSNSSDKRIGAVNQRGLADQLKWSWRVWAIARGLTLRLEWRRQTTDYFFVHLLRSFYALTKKWEIPRIFCFLVEYPSSKMSKEMA